MWLLDQIAEVNALSRPRTGVPHVATALLVDGPTAGRATVRLFDGDPASVPALPGVYDGIRTVQVQVDSSGRPVLVMAPTTPTPVSVPQEPAPAPAPDTPEEEETRTTVKTRRVYVSDSGTWSTHFSAWGSWGQSWEGHPYSAGQGSIFNSGPLIGAGFYGSQVTGLGAKEITKATVKIVGARQGYGWTPVLRLITNGSKPSGAPSYASSDTVTGPALGWDDVGYVNLPASMREALRTGAARGIALVGSSYGVSRGKGTAGLSLALEYEVPV